MVNIKKLFAEFLHDKGVTTEYAEAFLTGDHGDFPSFLTDHHAMSYISAAFTWCEQRDGVDWMNLSVRWREIVRSHE